MRIPSLLTLLMMCGLLCLCGSRAQDTCMVTVTLTDSESSQDRPGLIRVTDPDGKMIVAANLLSRGTGLSDDLPIGRWSVLAKSTTLELPQKKLTIEAISGLETERATRSIDLSGKPTASVSIALNRFYDTSAQGLRSANTHLHLQKITRADCDRYLSEIPKADGLDMLFLSYLERAVADLQYTSNRYTNADLARLTQASGVVFGNGEEHRHNFAGFGEGFGHVMLLNIKKLIQPVSIGAGIMKVGVDDIPLQRGIDTARRDGARIVWCHNDWGMESVPNWLSGRIDAQNIFDGGIRSSYKDSFYRYLNAGIKVPFSTGTDWFMYDFSRVYVRMDERLTPANWLDALVAGRSYITNGPFLEFQVDGKSLGDTIQLKKAATVNIVARAMGRVDFKQIELIQNGQVVEIARSQPIAGHFQAGIKQKLKIDAPGWLALRTPPPSVGQDPQLQNKTPLNELGRELFAHTSPIYLEVDGDSVFNKKIAREFLAEMEASRAAIVKHAKQIKVEGDQRTESQLDVQALARVLDVYADGITNLRTRLQTPPATE